MSEKFSRIKGFADFFEPESLEAYTHIEASTGARYFLATAFRKCAHPSFEYTALFQRGIRHGNRRVVQKGNVFLHGQQGQIHVHEAGGDCRRRFGLPSRLGLRPGQVSLFLPGGPMFRHERPQKGRMRQFHQINCECLGTESPYADAELICMLLAFLKSLEIRGLTLKLNSLGCAKCRPHYHEALRKFMAGVPRERLCANCRRRLETNPLRLLDCKEAECRSLLQNVPHLEDHVCSDCREHFETVRLCWNAGKSFMKSIIILSAAWITIAGRLLK